MILFSNKKHIFTGYAQEINRVFVQEIYSFQQQFLHTLENALDTEAQFHNLDSPSQFKVSWSSMARIKNNKG